MVTSHSEGDVLASPTDTLIWNDPSETATEWSVYIGSAPGGQQYDSSGNLGALTAFTSNALPGGGDAVYVRLWYKIG